METIFKKVCITFILVGICANVLAQVDNVNEGEIRSDYNKKTEISSKQLEAWQAFSPPPDKKFDWIQLTSGEWLKGEIKGFYNFSMEFDSDELDLLKLDWDDIQQIRSAGLKSIRIESSDGNQERTTLIGVFELNGDKAKVIYEDQVIEFSREHIVSIADGATREADRWSAKLSLGMNIRSGNSDLVDANLFGNTKRLTADSRIVMEYVGNFSEAENIETSNNHRFNFQFDLFKTVKFFWRPVFMEYFRDTFKNIDHQGTLGTAFGYHFIRTAKTELELTGGVGVLYKRFVSVEQDNSIDNVSPSLSLGTKYDTELSSWLDYLFDFNFQIVDQESGTYIHHFITTLETDLFNDFDLDVSFVWDRIQKPQPAADGSTPKKDDYQLIVGIGYEF